jgi:hypothetical protein
MTQSFFLPTWRPPYYEKTCQTRAVFFVVWGANLNKRKRKKGEEKREEKRRKRKEKEKEKRKS